ncbi:eukaryotic translation initiation factor 3 subunit K-like [Amphiura filiformis]|uniref:eukaryotic translation initiation factor 3 subunit K-like n=1 Tax=Amphiura filiformis TaxID=82378 RepID=UPI003B213ECF
MAFEEARATVSSMLKGIDRNLGKLERYVGIQCRENAYDLEANLAVLKLYQLNPAHFKIEFAGQVLLKALTNLPHTDFILCKCLIDEVHQQEEPIVTIIYLSNLLETCQFKRFWADIESLGHLFADIQGFSDSIRKYICHVLRITYQTIERNQLQDLLGYLSDAELNGWMKKYSWTATESGDRVFIANQEESIKTKNITEKISFESVGSVMKLTN